MIDIRIADYTNVKHGEDIVYLLDNYAKDPMGGGEPLSDFSKLNLISELAKIPHAFTVLAYADAQPIGLINCFEGFSTFSCQPLINIHDVAVLSEFRGKGVSQLMLKKVEEIALEKGCCKLTLEILERNKAALGAYTKFGFSAYELNPLAGKAVFWKKDL